MFSCLKAIALYIDYVTFLILMVRVNSCDFMNKLSLSVICLNLLVHVHS